MRKIFFITLLACVAFASNLHAQTYTLARTFLNPSTDIDDEFGLTTALFGNTLLIGALEDDTFGPNQGIVYLFETGTGNIIRTFQDPTPNPSDGEVGFGVSIAVNGNNIIIGAHRDDAVDGDDGAVYLFDGLNGSLLRTFNNPASGGVGGGDLFGSSVAFVGNNVLISSPGEDAEGTNAGRVYLFDGATGTLIHTFINPTPAIHSGFGNRIAVAGSFIVIRAAFNVAASVDAGAVYVFDSSNFALIQTILNPSSDPEDDFGSFIATDSNNILVGASGNDTGGTDSGVAYLFDATTGALLHTFQNPTPAANDLFGLHGEIFGNKILIGSPRGDTGATDAGAAYLFDSVTGNLITTFLNPAPAFEDLFGRSFAVLNNAIFIGAPGQTQPNAGKVYLFVEQPIVDAGADKEICFGQSVTIGGNPTATGGTPPYTYSWTPIIGLNDASAANPNASPNSTTEYTVQVTDANGIIATDQVIVTVNPLPAVTFNSVASLCVNVAAVDLTSFVSPTGGTFSGPGITGNTFTPSAAGAGTHMVTYTFADANNCSNSATQNIVVNALPTVAFNPVGPFCVSAAAVDLTSFVSPTGGTFSGPGIAGNIFTPSAAGVGTHTITYTFADANNCGNSATQNIVVNALPTVTFNSVGPFCVNAAAVDLTTFISPAGGTFSGTGIFGNIFSPSAAGVGTHTITYTFADANNCSNTATQSITVSSQASVTFNPVGPFCENAAAVDLTNFVSPTGGTFSGPGITGNVFTPSAAGVGTHTIAYTFADANNCGNSASQNITVHPQPTVTFNAVGPFCANTPAVDLSSAVSPAGGTFSGPGIAGSMFNPSTAGIGTYVITYTITNANCGNSASQNLVVNPVPTANAGLDKAICVGQSVTIGGNPTATGGMSPYTFSWTPTTGLDNATAANPTASPTSTIIYTVNIVDANGCTASDQVTIAAQTPQSAIQDLINEVDALVAAGKLNQGQGNALKAKLNAAMQQLNKGKTNTAINQLQAFINQVNAFINAGILSPADGQALIDAANNIINCISGLNKAGITEQSPTIALPQRFALEQNYPNPFNPETEIRFQLPEATHVVVKIFNTLGEEIRTLADGLYEAGYHNLRWDGKDKNGNPLSSGVYLYQLRAKTFSQIKKMILLQ